MNEEFSFRVKCLEEKVEALTAAVNALVESSLSSEFVEKIDRLANHEEL